jgi:cytochrome c biogenesis protein CcmG/thiol:disulfide interchange protein DsbE
MRRVLLLIPLVIFLVVAVFLYRGLFLDPSELPSALIGKPFPAFALPSVDGQGTLSEAVFKGQPSLVNVWATWCPTCREEHAMLNRLALQGVTIHGIDYKDDSAAAQRWLAQYGNPYQLNVSDVEGSLGLDLGVYGAPETFLVDRDGIIRHKYVGEINERVWREQLAPLWAQLSEEGGQ